VQWYSAMHARRRIGLGRCSFRLSARYYTAIHAPTSKVGRCINVHELAKRPILHNYPCTYLVGR